MHVEEVLDIRVSVYRYSIDIGITMYGDSIVSLYILIQQLYYLDAHSQTYNKYFV